MEERKYSDFNDESLLIESLNTISEMKAFMCHHCVSERKVEQLSTKVNELVAELNIRIKKLKSSGDSKEINEMISILLNVVEELKNLIEKLRQRFLQTQPGA